MPDVDDWQIWLALNPPPNLQALVATWGGYSNIPGSAWAEWDIAVTQWETARRDRLLGGHTWALMAGMQNAKKNKR